MLTVKRYHLIPSKKKNKGIDGFVQLLWTIDTNSYWDQWTGAIS